MIWVLGPLGLARVDAVQFVRPKSWCPCYRLLESHGAEVSRLIIGAYRVVINLFSKSHDLPSSSPKERERIRNASWISRARHFGRNGGRVSGVGS